ncbi:hypothetical protein Dfri01_16100 [Dyadobacter frigoris]|nr:hypothetical protein Dfri01_16100 [Dyadobacter frigoris]
MTTVSTVILSNVPETFPDKSSLKPFKEKAVIWDGSRCRLTNTPTRQLHTTFPYTANNKKVKIFYTEYINTPNEQMPNIHIAHICASYKTIKSYFDSKKAEVSPFELTSACQSS